MKSGYVKFKDPCILHEGLVHYQVEDKIREHSFRESELYRNGIYLEEEVFGTDMPEEIRDKKFYFKDKVQHKDSSEDIFAYLTNIRGIEVLVEDRSFETEEIPVVPDELFEM